MKSLLVILTALALSGCHLPCCPDTAEEAGLPVRVQYPNRKPAVATRPAEPTAPTEPADRR